MAIPTNYIDKITDHDSGGSRPICPPAEHVQVDNENFEGETLDEVLDEVAQAIEDAGQGGYAPPQGGIPKNDLAQDVQDSLDKADSALQDEDVAEIAKTGDYDDLQNKPTIPDTSNLATKTELNTKQDKISAGNGITIGNDGKTVSVADAIRTGATAGATAVQSVTINGGNPVTPDNNGNVDLGNVQGQKGDKGDKGDTVVIDPSQVEQFDIINGLNSTTAGDALDAYQGKRLKDQIDYVYARLQAVYAALGNAAFWDGKPSASTILPNLDWGLPKHTLTLNLTLSNASVKVNGTAYANGDTLSVEEYSTLSVLIEAASGHTFATAPTLAFGGTSVTLTANQDGSYSADVVMGQSDATMAVSATGVASYSISYGTLSHCSATTAPTSIISGNQATIVFGVDSGYRLAQNGISVTNASIVSYDASTGTLVIGNATGNVSISATATEIGTMFLKGYFINNEGILKNENFVVGSTDLTDRLVLSDYILLPTTTPASANAQYGINRNNNTSEIPCCLSLFEKLDGGGYKILRYWTMSGSATGRAITVTGDSNFAAISAAASAGKLYARIAGYMNSEKTAISTCSLQWNNSYVFNAASNHYTLTDDATEFEPYTKS